MGNSDGSNVVRYSVGISVAVDIGMEEGDTDGAVLNDGCKEGTNELDGFDEFDGVPLGFVDGISEGIALVDGATDVANARIDPLLSTLGVAETPASRFPNRSKPPQTAAIPTAVRAATVHPPIIVAVVLRWRIASGVEARIMFLLIFFGGEGGCSLKWVGLRFEVVRISKNRKMGCWYCCYALVGYQVLAFDKLESFSRF